MANMTLMSENVFIDTHLYLSNGERYRYKHRIENLKNLKTAAEVLTPFTYFFQFLSLCKVNTMMGTTIYDSLDLK
jgi:hypothetical protein